MSFLVLLAVFLGVWSFCRLRRLIAYRVDNLTFLLLIAAGLHGILIFPYIGNFTKISEWEYTLIYSLVYTALGGGIYLAAKAESWWGRWRPDPKIPVQVPNVGLWGVAMGLIAFVMASNLMNYYEAVGSWNPLEGVRNMFSGVNSANAMWDMSGSENWGAGRGGTGEGGMLAYFRRWFSLLPLVLLPFLGRRWLPYVLAAFIGTKVLALTGGYSSRTTLVVWCGVLLFFCNQHIRPFRTVEVIVVLVAAFVLLQVLHMARLGGLQLHELTDSKAISSGFESAVVDTLEPTGWGFKAYESLGRYSFAQAKDHFLSYFGAVVPRILWSSKPYYSFEPDLTILLTQSDISGQNPVRTFSVVTEGLLVGGKFGVMIVCGLYAFFAITVDRFLARYWEYAFVRYWWILMAVIMYRTSLFTLFSTAFLLAVAPAIVIGVGLRQVLRLSGWKPSAASSEFARVSERPSHQRGITFSRNPQGLQK